MNEIFDVKSTVSYMKERIEDLYSRIAFLCKYPSLIAFNYHVEEGVACRILHVSKSKIYQMRQKGEITFFRDKRKILYPVSTLVQNLAYNTVQIKSAHEGKVIQ